MTDDGPGPGDGPPPAAALPALLAGLLAVEARRRWLLRRLRHGDDVALLRRHLQGLGPSLDGLALVLEPPVAPLLPALLPALRQALRPGAGLALACPDVARPDDAQRLLAQARGRLQADAPVAPDAPAAPAERAAAPVAPSAPAAPAAGDALPVCAGGFAPDALQAALRQAGFAPEPPRAQTLLWQVADAQALLHATASAGPGHRAAPWAPVRSGGLPDDLPGGAPDALAQALAPLLAPLRDEQGIWLRQHRLLWHAQAC